MTPPALFSLTNTDSLQVCESGLAFLVGVGRDTIESAVWRLVTTVTRHSGCVCDSVELRTSFFLTLKTETCFPL